MREDPRRRSGFTSGTFIAHEALTVKRLISSTLSLCSMFALVPGCGQGESPSGRQQLPAGASGEALNLAPGVTVSDATYRIAGPNGFSSAGSVPVGESPDVSVPVSGLPPGTGYTMDLSALASDEMTICDGRTQFTVPSGGSVTVVVHLTCAIPVGDIRVTATTNLCPVIDSLEANPAEARIGGHMVLSVVAHDSDNGPSVITYKWSANGRALPGQTQPTLTFTCTSVGSVAVRSGVFDGDPNCVDTLIANLVCSP
jgi:hypothetical protein